MHYQTHIGAAVLILAYMLAAKLKVLPTVQGFQEFVSTFNTKAGNIFILGAMSLLFFETAVHMTYWCLDRLSEGKLTVDNAVMMLGLTFVTGSCFGGSFGAMLKVMSGEDVIIPKEPPQPGAQEKPV